MPAYVIYQGEVTDPERYDDYKPRSAESVAAAGGRFVVRAGAIESLEGDAPPSRTVVIEFPTMQAAIDRYRGEAYTAARELREGAAVANLYVVDGAD